MVIYSREPAWEGLQSHPSICLALLQLQSLASLFFRAVGLFPGLPMPIILKVYCFTFNKSPACLALFAWHYLHILEMPSSDDKRICIFSGNKTSNIVLVWSLVWRNNSTLVWWEWNVPFPVKNQDGLKQIINENQRSQASHPLPFLWLLLGKWLVGFCLFLVALFSLARMGSWGGLFTSQRILLC